MNTRGKSISLLGIGLVVGSVLAPPTVQAATNYFDVAKTVTGTGTANCGTGWKVTGGGAGALPSDYYSGQFSEEYSVTASFPSSGTAWKVTGVRVHGAKTTDGSWSYTEYDYSPKAYARCTQ